MNNLAEEIGAYEKREVAKLMSDKNISDGKNPYHFAVELKADVL